MPFFGKYVIAVVTHWNGTVIRGLVTGGDGAGIFVQRSGIEKTAPVFCDFTNVKNIEFTP